VSGASPGGAAGAILAGPAAAVRLFARTLIGLAIGADSAIATAYIPAEYAPKNRRGSLAMLQQWTITVGILVAYIVALIIFSAFPGGAASTGWRLVLGPGAIPALMGLGLHTQMPQSPR
jgi:MFS family permease